MVRQKNRKRLNVKQRIIYLDTYTHVFIFILEFFQQRK